MASAQYVQMAGLTTMVEMTHLASNVLAVALVSISGKHARLFKIVAVHHVVPTRADN